MIFVAKSAPTLSGLKDKRDKGFNKIEIQLVKTTIEDEYNIITSVPNIDIVGVHTPLIKRNGVSYDIDIAYLSNSTYCNIFVDTCELAEKLAMYYKHEIYVVLHNSLCSYNILNMDVLIEDLINIFKLVINKYKHLKFYIENVTPLTFDDKFRNGVYIEDTNYLVELLTKRCGNYFGITYDTCHNMMTEQYHTKLLLDNEKATSENYKFKQFSNDYIFSNFGNSIKNIHLNNIIKCGSMPKTHGTPFVNCKKDIEYLTKFFEAYNKYNCNAFITLEIREDDYSNSVNIIKTMSLIKEILGI